MFNLPEQITVWNIIGNSGFGDKTYSLPIVYASRQALKSEKFTDTNGDQLMSVAVSYTRGVDVKIGSLVFFGESAEPIPVQAANDVRLISQTPSASGDIKKLWFA